jgi:hypothetical protein
MIVELSKQMGIYVNDHAVFLVFSDWDEMNEVWIYSQIPLCGSW